MLKTCSKLPVCPKSFQLTVSKDDRIYKKLMEIILKLNIFPFLGTSMDSSIRNLLVHQSHYWMDSSQPTRQPSTTHMVRWRHSNRIVNRCIGDVPIGQCSILIRRILRRCMCWFCQMWWGHSNIGSYSTWKCNVWVNMRDRMCWSCR